MEKAIKILELKNKRSALCKVHVCDYPLKRYVVFVVTPRLRSRIINSCKIISLQQYSQNLILAEKKMFFPLKISSKPSQHFSCFYTVPYSVYVRSASSSSANKLSTSDPTPTPTKPQNRAPQTLRFFAGCAPNEPPHSLDRYA